MLPVFGDQPSNAVEAERRGYGLNLPITELTSEKLLSAVLKILQNPKFRQRAEEYGQMVMDQMTSPMERAVWWIEYAMRYPGMKHMKSPVHELHWTQYFLLDILIFLLLSAIFVTFIFVSLCKCCCKKTLFRTDTKHKTD